jgi:hypothetical protein
MAEAFAPPELSDATRGVVAPDRWVWVVYLASGEPLAAEGTVVVLDFIDGTVYEVVNIEE